MAEIFVHDLEVQNAPYRMKRNSLGVFSAAGIALLTVQVLAEVVDLLKEIDVVVPDEAGQTDENNNIYEEIILNRPFA